MITTTKHADEQGEVIVRAGTEGGSYTIYGGLQQRTSGDSSQGTEAPWTFWRKSNEEYVDDNGNEASYSTKSGETSDLHAICPPNLFRLYPTVIHPAFASWFRKAFEEHKEAQNDAPRSRYPDSRLRTWEERIAKAEAQQRTALRMGKGNIALTPFIDDDEGYFGWLAGNPTGFVVNCYRNPTPAYLVLHRSTCFHIQRWEGRTLTSGDYRKVCSQAVSELHTWASTVGGTLRPCSSCQPVPGDASATGVSKDA